MNEQLVVLTFPGHYLLTALTIQSYLKFQNPQKITVVVDDLHPMAWPSYLEDCASLYAPATIVKISSIPNTNKFVTGWLRQQIAKLYLDHVIDSDQWFFTDGDVQFTQPVGPMTYYTIIPNDDVQPGQNRYVQKLLNLDNPGIRVDNQQVCVSSPPFRLMSAAILQSLRNHVQAQTNVTMDQIHLDLDQYNYRNGWQNYVYSEWELIENYRLHVLKESVDLVNCAEYHIKNPPQVLEPCYFQTHYGTDRDLGSDFFAQYNITVTQESWERLNKIHR